MNNIVNFDLIMEYLEHLTSELSNETNGFRVGFDYCLDGSLQLVARSFTKPDLKMSTFSDIKALESEALSFCSGGWRLIGTAPKDRKIMLINRTGECYIRQWYEPWKAWVDYLPESPDDNDEYYSWLGSKVPIYWKELPVLPEKVKEYHSA